MDWVTVVVATYGHPRWLKMAKDRAIPSAAEQAPVIHVHGDNLHDARNSALHRVQTPYVIHLDGDDQLERGYVDAMATGKADVRCPAVRQIRGRKPMPVKLARVWNHSHDCKAKCLLDGNWLVIGACVSTDLVRRVGGWREWPVYEDFDLWQRCYLAGASFETIRTAIYRAYMRPGNRNRSLPIKARNQVHYDIDRANGVRA